MQHEVLGRGRQMTLVGDCDRREKQCGVRFDAYIEHVATGQPKVRRVCPAGRATWRDYVEILDHGGPT